jgi:hypothetical protein
MPEKSAPEQFPLEHSTKEWAIYCYAVKSHLHTKLKNFIIKMFEESVDLPATPGQTDGLPAFRLTEKMTRELVGIIAAERRAGALTTRLLKEKAYLIENGDELQKAFLAAAAADDVGKTVSDLNTEVDAFRATAEKPEAPQPGASERNR